MGWQARCALRGLHTSTLLLTPCRSYPQLTLWETWHELLMRQAIPQVRVHAWWCLMWRACQPDAAVVISARSGLTCLAAEAP